MTTKKNQNLSIYANIAQIIIAIGSIATFIFIVCQHRSNTERDYDKQAMNIYYEYSKINLTSPPKNAEDSIAFANIVITSMEAIYNYCPNSIEWKNTLTNVICEHKQLTNEWFEELTVTKGFAEFYNNIDCQ